MQKYDSYKNSGIDWLGDIPSHWEIEKGKWIYNKLERPVLPDYEVVTCFRDGQVTLRINRREDGFTNSLKEIGYQGIKKGDLVIHQMDAFAGAIGVSDSEGKATPVYSVCTSRFGKSNNYYFAYFLRSMALAGVITSLAKGIRERSTDFRFNDFASLLYPLPPISEQEAIAAFLDEKCGKIDELVSVKEQQIALLKERRQVVIHEAVTKGIQLDVEMKDSGIDWIGEIPSHWEVRRFKFLCSITTGSKNTEDKVDEGKYPFFVRSQTEERINSYSFEGEAILTAGDGAGVGKVYHYINGKFDFHQRVYKFSDFNDVIGKYLFQYLSSEFYNVAILGTAKSTVDSLRLPLIQDFMIAFPTLKNEQEAIVAYLEEQTSKIDQAIALKTEQIEKLNAYKQSLINEVVTGKVKVA